MSQTENGRRVIKAATGSGDHGVPKTWLLGTCGHRWFGDQTPAGTRGIGATRACPTCKQRVRTQQSNPNRLCKGCGTRLSVYNGGDRCGPCS